MTETYLTDEECLQLEKLIEKANDKHTILAMVVGSIERKYGAGVAIIRIGCIMEELGLRICAAERKRSKQTTVGLNLTGKGTCIE